MRAVRLLILLMVVLAGCSPASGPRTGVHLKVAGVQGLVAYTEPFRPDTMKTVFSGLTLANDGSVVVRLRALRPMRKDPHIVVLGVVVMDERENRHTSFFAQCGGLPLQGGWINHPVDGYEIHPGATVYLGLGLEALERKAGGIDGVELMYDVPATHQEFRQEAQYKVGFRVDDPQLACSQITRDIFKDPPRS